ncbi:hypothetical protein [Acaryochloris sp. IP29b_bin.148]|uniref:hypothetical protein n=1 Tax=Acaryochloris sp. IP29b_bin.148 TaxID=2969218 RepID=UPI00260E5C8B|nr:hypothetical protein [Acaryochloris sp. IP29b_bin.148]
MISSSNHCIQNLVICIPAHNPSQELVNALKSIDTHVRAWCRDQNIICTLLITNSGVPININGYWQGDFKIFKVPSHFYWSAAVQFLFTQAKSFNPTHILLMNHDILAESTSFLEIVELLSKYPKAVISSISVTSRDRIIENAGFLYKNGALPFSNPYCEKPCKSLPKEPYQVDSLNGRFVLFPVEAANPNFLVPHLVPHYFADTLLSANARRNGFSLVIAPKSIIFSAQHDTEFKRSRQRCDTLQGLFRCLFTPYSYRYIWGGFWGQLMLADNFILGVIISIKYTSGRIIKSFLEYFGIITPL